MISVTTSEISFSLQVSSNRMRAVSSECGHLARMRLRDTEGYAICRPWPTHFMARRVNHAVNSFETMLAPWPPLQLALHQRPVVSQAVKAWVRQCLPGPGSWPPARGSPTIQKMCCAAAISLWILARFAKAGWREYAQRTDWLGWSTFRGHNPVCGGDMVKRSEILRMERFQLVEIRTGMRIACSC